MIQSKKRRLVAVLIVVGVVGLFLGWYYGSPRWTLYEMKTAAESGDTEKLASYIDFPSVRTSMKEALKAEAAAQLTKKEGFEALGAMFAMTMVDSMVDAMITPAALRKMFVVDKTKGPEGITKVDATDRSMEIRHDGLSRFRLVDRAKTNGAALTFVRDGLSWKLTGLELPVS